MKDVSTDISLLMREIDEAGLEGTEKKTLLYKPGDLIFKEGDFGVALYRIVSGTVSIFKEQHGQEMLQFELTCGDVFGEMVLIDKGHSPRTASAVAKDAVELDSWHYLALWKEYQTKSPIIRLLAADMVEKLEKICAAHGSLIMQKKPKQQKPQENAAAGAQLILKKPSSMFKLVGVKPVGKKWDGLVDYRLLDNPTTDIFHAAGVAIDEEGIQLDISLANKPKKGHELGKIDMTIHLAGSAPLKVWGEIVSISGGALAGHTALRVQFRNMKPETHQRIKTFLTT